jgi:NAD(P)H-dependent FMN reductase
VSNISLLAQSGSLRAASYKSAAIEALKGLAPSQVDVAIGAIDELPLFNPDRENECIPALERLKSQLANVMV